MKSGISLYIFISSAIIPFSLLTFLSVKYGLLTKLIKYLKFSLKFLLPEHKYWVLSKVVEALESVPDSEK